MASNDETEPDELGTYDLLLTSGNELYVPASVRKTIEDRAKREPNAVVLFELAVLSLERLEEEFQQGVERSLQDSPEERSKRLAAAEKIPQRVHAWAIAFKRNYDVVAEVLSRADGFCQSCGAPGSIP